MYPSRDDLLEAPRVVDIESLVLVADEELPVDDNGRAGSVGTDKVASFAQVVRLDVQPAEVRVALEEKGGRMLGSWRAVDNEV